MELWTVSNKTILLLYVIAASYLTVQSRSSWFVMYVLLYAALSMLVLIISDRSIKLGIVVCILAGLLGCTACVQPCFALLLPMTVCELASLFTGRPRFVLLAVLLPLPFVQGGMLTLYALVAVLTLFHYELVGRYAAKVSVQEDRMEELRADRQRLAKRLSENEDYIRTNEHMSKLEERNRLSQQIHDGIGHAMTGALIQMEAAKRLIRTDPATAETLLQNAIGISKEGIEQIRLTLKNVKPPQEQLGLNRLKMTVEAFGASTNLLTTVVHHGNMEVITPQQWRIIYENVTEALTNAAKYAQASAVHVEVTVLGRVIKAVVADNGRGVDKVVKGLGLRGMEERAAAVNGTVIADGTRGFTVTTLLPYKTQD
jgi:signal transduction histidine kinase